MEEKPPEGETRVKRKMKTAAQLELLEKTYAVNSYPSESIRAELSEQLGLSDRQLQMWFCHRRLKDRKTPSMKRTKKDAEVAASSSGGAGDEVAVGELGNEHCSVLGSGSSLFGHNIEPKLWVVPRMNAGVAVARISADMPPLKRHYQPPQAVSELRAIAFVESQLGEPLREDGPILGMEFDPLPPGAFGAPIVTVAKPKPDAQPYEFNLYERPVAKLMKGAGRALHEYQFLPEQPSVRDDIYGRGAQSQYFDSPPHVPISRSALSTGRSVMHGNEQVPSGHSFQGQKPGLSHFPHEGWQGHALPKGLSHLPHEGWLDHVLPSTSGEYDIVPRKTSNFGMDAHAVAQPLSGLESPMVPLERRVTPDEDLTRLEKKRKSDEARIAREVEAHEKRIRKELEKQDILRRKREEQMRKEMERQDRERRKEEERLLREKQREEERYQREQRREMERREKFMQKESIRAEKMRLKEEQRRKKEAARQKAANDRATARRIAKESMELIEDERLELMELAAASKGFPSIISLNSDDLHNLDLLKNKKIEFPPKSVCLKRPFAIQPWIESKENVGNLLMVWRFLITFADLLGLWPFTLDELIQAFHDYDSRLLGEIHIALLRSIIKDIEDVARAPSSGLGATQNNAANPGGGHPQIVERAYAWGFDIRSWQRHLNLLTWPEILRQFALSAGFGPKLKKRNIEQTHLHDENEGNDGEDIISSLRSGVAAEKAVAIMQERGFSNPRRSRHRLTPGTVKYAAFHVLSLEGSDGLTILEVADKIQRSGLRDLTTSKTPEASIAAALSRDTKLFERIAPSTYCVRTPYRKDPVDAEAILSSAREKIQIFENGFLNEDAEDVENDGAERDEDSESDVAEDPEADELCAELKRSNECVSSETERFVGKTVPVDWQKSSSKNIMKMRQINQKDSSSFASLVQSEELEARGTGSAVDLSTNATILDEEDTVFEDSNSCESWVHGLMEGEYSDLSIEERLNAIVALVGVSNEGNSVRIVLEERMEAANALKKQMWAEAQLDKRRMKEEYAMKMHCIPYISNRIETSGQISSAEGRQSPFHTVDDKIGLSLNNSVVEKDHVNNLQADLNDQGLFLAEYNSEVQEFFSGHNNISLLQSGCIVERSRSQLKAYVGHKVEEIYVYRSLPLGQDRRYNRYWQFKTTSENDPGSGRIFVELHNGFWSLIDSEEGFDSLVASLDVRGLRESHLHTMLQKVEVSFKETLRKNLVHSSFTGVTVDNVKTENAGSSSNPDSGVSSKSTTRAVCALNTNMLETSSSFVIRLGGNETERQDLFKRYQDFETWMWKECLNSSVLCAVKDGKHRCKLLLSPCDDCHDLHLIDENHCPSCGRIYKTYAGGSSFSEHVAQCEEELKGNVGRSSQDLDSTLPSRIKLLKVLFVLMEVSVPAEALHSAWSEGLRKSLDAKLHAASSAKDVLQILTLLEGSIKKDFLSLDFETTAELLGSCNRSDSAANIFMSSVLPWIPKTSSAVALRLMELDSSISFTSNQEVNLQKDQAAGDFITPLTKFAVGGDISEDVLAEAPYEAENLQLDPWLESSNLHSSLGRGRGTRGRGRGRARGGRPPKRVLGSRSEAASQRITPTNKEGLVQLMGWKGRPRARGGRKRGRPSVGNSQKPVKGERVAEIGNGRDQSKQSLFENNLRRLVLVPQWGWETMQVEAADDNDSSSSGSERSEYDGYNNGQAMQDDYDDLAIDDYNAVFIGKSGHLMDGVDYNIRGMEDEDDRTGELDNDVEEDDIEEDGLRDIDVGGYINGDSNDECDGVGKQISNPDEATSSSSSEYSN